MTDEDTRARVTALTERLVATPSHEDPTAAGDVLVEWLETETDARVERDAHGNVVARRGPRDAAASLALVGHHDVVPPAPGQTREGAADTEYVVERRDGRLYGRGTADMKGSLAAALLAFADAERATLRRAGLELHVVSFVGEEQGGVGCRAAIDDGYAPDYAVVGEGSTGYSAPGVTDVAVAHKGRRGSTITARGTAAHASEPAAGENAIYRASDAVDVVRELSAPTATVQGESLSGSVAVTEIDGGEAWNVIPETCTVTVDERTVPGERAPLERVERLDGVSLTVDQDLPPMACDDAAFADAVLAAARAVQSDASGVTRDAGQSDASDDPHDAVQSDAPDDDRSVPQHVVKPHATDAGWLAQAGTTCVVCGASEPGEAHTDTESVSLDVLTRCVDLYGEAVARVAAVVGDDEAA
ncbi:M20 family metallopeptidase [Halobaculum sp. MBLA0147]|uniref:M20 family metallopeptidase n=1 Tax=Halobaculum sp. MBLA0147 TaxID=3079934 RepID=UPI0035233450